MPRYLLRRGLFGVFTLFVVVSSVFFLLRLAPGGPFDGERQLPPEIEANLRAAYNLDAPLLSQYATYMAGLTHGDFGPSFRQKDFSVGELIEAGLPTSLSLGIGGLLLALLLGLAVGISAGLSPGSVLDQCLMSISSFF